MTTLVAVIGQGKTVMAADSAVTFNGEIQQRVLPKIFRAGDMLIGAAGLSRLGTVLRNRVTLTCPGPDEDLDDFMVETFCPHLQTILSDNHLWDDVERRFDGCLLVAVRDVVFEVHGNLDPCRFVVPFNSVGSGSSYALGSLHATTSRWADPEYRADQALYAAAQFDNCTRLPSTVVTLDHPAPRPALRVVGA